MTLVRRLLWGVLILVCASSSTEGLNADDLPAARRTAKSARFTVRGRVLDDRGNAIPGAEIRLGIYRPDNLAAKTDVQGSFQLDGVAVTETSILVTAPGKAAEAKQLKIDRDAQVEFRLRPSPVLKIRIVDPDGNPIEGVKILGDDWRKTALLIQFRTDREGRVIWTEAPDDQVEYMIRKPGYAARINLVLTATGEEHVLTLPRVLHLEATVTDVASNQPIERFTWIPALQPRGDVSFVTERWTADSGGLERRRAKVDATSFSYRIRIEADNPTARDRLEALIEQKVDTIDRICGLADAQKEKLRLAGRGDIRAYFDQVEEIKVELQRSFVEADENRTDLRDCAVRMAQELSREIKPLRLTLNRLPLDEGSVFVRTLRRTLTAEQTAKFETLREVVLLGGSVITRQSDSESVVHEVRLSETTISDDGLARLKGLTALRALNLAGTHVTDSGLAHLKSLANLQDLCLANTMVTDAGIGELQRALPNLKVTK